MPTVKQISIKSATSATGYDTREIGAEAINVEVQYDASGNIITDLSTQNPDPSKTESLAKVLDNKAPEDHADTTTKYGAASQTEYGHVKVGAGLDVTNGEVSVKYGTTAGTAVEGNDIRLSNDRKNPNALSFADGTSYDGSVAKSIDADSVGAAVKNHASATDEFGAGTQTMFGHVKVSDVYNTDLGTASTSLAASQHAIYEVYQEAIRSSGSAGRELTKAEYDALTEDEKSDGTIYFITDWNQDGGGGGATATEISFDDGVTQLGVTNVQKAIEKLTDARNITFNNVLTGIEATNVQDAIDYAIENGDGVGGSLFSIYSDEFTNNPVQAVVTHADTDHGDYDGEESKVVVFKPTTDPNEQAFGAYKASLYFEAVGEIEIRVYSLDRSEVLKTKTIGAHTYNHYLVKMDSHYFEDVLVAAGYSASDYASLTDLFADEIATRKVMTLHASVDALFNWGHDHETEENFDSLFDNDIAMKWLGLRDYACDKFMSYEPFKTKMLESQYWERILKDHVPVMTSNTAPYGEAFSDGCWQNEEISKPWNAFSDNSNGFSAATNTEGVHYIGYRFVNPVCVRRFNGTVLYANGLRLKNFKLQGSNDNSTWTDLYSGTLQQDGTKNVSFDIKIDNNDYYSYYRMYLMDAYQYGYFIKYLQFYGRQLNVSVPVMTSDTAPWGECFGSSILGSGYEYYKAFDGTTDDNWHGSNQTVEYVGYKFTTPYIIQKFRFVPHYGTTGLFCKHYKIQGSNDGNNWADLYEETIASNSTYDVTKDTTQNRDKAYLYVRVYIDSSYESTSGGKSVKLLQFYGPDYSEREFEEGSTMKYIYDHGVKFEELTATGYDSELEPLYENGQIYFNPTNEAKHRYSGLNNAVDVTPYAILRAKIGDKAVIANSSYGFMTLAETKANAVESAMSSAYKNITSISTPENEIYVDVSGINKNEYININSGYQTRSLTITEWWLE